jgi:hypothetical protein
LCAYFYCFSFLFGVTGTTMMSAIPAALASGQVLAKLGLVLASRMYINAPDKAGPVVLAAPLFVAILICAVGVVVMGGYPEPWARAALQATAGLVLTAGRRGEPPPLFGHRQREESRWGSGWRSVRVRFI